MNEMTGFVVASVVLAVIVLGFVLRPLWREKPIAGVGVLLSLGLATGLVYALVGTPNALDPARRRLRGPDRQSADRGRDAEDRDPEAPAAARGDAAVHHGILGRRRVRLERGHADLHPFPRPGGAARAAELGLWSPFEANAPTGINFPEPARPRDAAR